MHRRRSEMHTSPPERIVRSSLFRHEATMPRTTRASKAERLRTMRDLVSRMPVVSQGAFSELLHERGFHVTQATVSRDIAELGLVKVARGKRHVYASPEDLAPPSVESDDALLRLLGDLPVTIRRSGLILLLISAPAMANALAEAIDHSSLHEQEGTVAGDNTMLVLFANEDRLERWRARFEAIRDHALAAAGVGR